MKSSQEGKETQDLACADIERKKGQAGDEYDYERLFIRSAKRLCQNIKLQLHRYNGQQEHARYQFD